MSIARLWRRAMCRLGLHKRLDIIQSFGQAQHIGCPDCGRRFGIHHGMRTVVPWDGRFDEMYEFMGYDIKGAERRWQERRQANTSL